DHSAGANDDAVFKFSGRIDRRRTRRKAARSDQRWSKARERSAGTIRQNEGRGFGREVGQSRCDDTRAGRRRERGCALLTFEIAKVIWARAISWRCARNQPFGVAADLRGRRKRPDRYRSERLVETGVDHAPTIWR